MLETQCIEKSTPTASDTGKHTAAQAVEVVTAVDAVAAVLDDFENGRAIFMPVRLEKTDGVGSGNYEFGEQEVGIMEGMCMLWRVCLADVPDNIAQQQNGLARQYACVICGGKNDEQRAILKKAVSENVRHPEWAAIPMDIIKQGNVRRIAKEIDAKLQVHAVPDEGLLAQIPLPDPDKERFRIAALRKGIREGKFAWREIYRASCFPLEDDGKYRAERLKGLRNYLQLSLVRSFKKGGDGDMLYKQYHDMPVPRDTSGTASLSKLQDDLRAFLHLAGYGDEHHPPDEIWLKIAFILKLGASPYTKGVRKK